ncbi:MAG: cobalt ECF transporter T component CbiQ [Synergistaceae bacterium]|jgi:cobalt/nickel transport system permease protein|nr:cobalt ECF transporter T component CbiQ [Synergistaceae bacterium]
MPQPDFGFSGATLGLKALELLAEGDTVIHRLHPFVKLMTTIVYVVVVISFGRYEIAALMPFFFYPAILMPLSETPCAAISKRLLPALPFALFGGLSNIFFDRTPMVIMAGMAVSGGVVSFVSIMIKTTLSVSAILLLVSTTGIVSLSRQLAALGIPDAIILQFTLTYRYLSVLAEEAGTMYDCYMLRSSDSRGIRMKDMGTFVGVLLLRGIDRAGRVYAAMKCRGFACSLPTHDSARAFDICYLFIVCGTIILLRCFT